MGNEWRAITQNSWISTPCCCVRLYRSSISEVAVSAALCLDDRPAKRTNPCLRYRIKAIQHPSRAPVQSREYLYFNGQVGKHNQEYTKGIQIQEMPVSSAIMEPWSKEVVVHEGSIHVKGWAYSGGGRWPERVEVSSDGGFIWYAVEPENMSDK